MEAQQAASVAPQCTNARPLGQYPGQTPLEAIQGEIGALLRAGYYESGAGNREAVAVLRSLHLGQYTAARMWAEAVRKHTAA
jgi:hypothetical protein